MLSACPTTHKKIGLDLAVKQSMTQQQKEVAGLKDSGMIREDLRNVGK